MRRGRYAIYPEQAISSAGSATAATGHLEENNCNLGPEFAKHQDDVGEVKLRARTLPVKYLVHGNLLVSTAELMMSNKFSDLLLSYE